MTTPDYADWTQPVSSVEHVTVLAAGGNVITVGGPQPTYDTSGLQSLTAVIKLPGTAAGTRYLLELSWADGSIVANDTISFHSEPSYPAMDPSVLSFQIPVRGVTLQATLSGPVGGSCLVALYGSTRAILSPRISRLGVAAPNIVLDTGSVNLLAAANSATFYCPPVTRSLRMWMGGSGTAGFAHLQGAIVNSGVMQAGEFGFWDWAAGNQTFENIGAVSTGMELVMHNSGAAAANFHVVLWDAS